MCSKILVNEWFWFWFWWVPIIGPFAFQMSLGWMDVNSLVPTICTMFIQCNFTLFASVMPILIGLNINLLEEFMHHPDLQAILEENAKGSYQTLITVRYNGGGITSVLRKIKSVGHHQW